MIDWDLAVKVASRFAGTYPLEETYHSDLLAREAPGIVARAAQMVEDETGLTAAGEPAVEVVTRKQWAETNVAVFSQLLAPAEEKIKKANPVASRVVAAEMGAVLGFLSRKVLGQYELVLPGKGESGDVVYLVGANVLAMERSHQFRPSEFRLWIALHECAHRLQFVEKQPALVVDRNHLVSPTKQPAHQMASGKTGAPRHQHFHAVTPSVERPFTLLPNRGLLLTARTISIEPAHQNRSASSFTMHHTTGYRSE